MKKFILALATVVVLALTGCGDAMHDSPASYVTFKFTGLPVADGKIDLRGAFFVDGWNASDKRLVTFTKGVGEWTTKEMILSSTLQFTLAVGSGWTRPWYPATTGVDNGYGEKTNFEVVDIPMDGGDHVVTVDGSTNPATITVK